MFDKSLMVERINAVFAMYRLTQNRGNIYHWSGCDQKDTDDIETVECKML